MTKKITLPLNTHCSTFFIGEAGSKGTNGKYFVVAAVKTSNPDKLSRAIQACRDRHRFNTAEELKFGAATKRSAPILSGAFKAAVDTGSTFGVFVLDKQHFDPWSSRKQWEGHLFATERLLRGLVTRSELGVALIDHIDVPAGVSYGDALINQCNSRLHNKRFVCAVSLDSRTNSGLQIADILVSSVFHARQKILNNGLESYLNDNSPKALLSKSIAHSLGISHFADCSNKIVRIQTSFQKSLKELKQMR
ncbi:DUF3800 domain-containing protein [Arcanobacterium hippocoleae]